MDHWRRRGRNDGPGAAGRQTCRLSPVVDRWSRSGCNPHDERARKLAAPDAVCTKRARTCQVAPALSPHRDHLSGPLIIQAEGVYRRWERGTRCRMKARWAGPSYHAPPRGQHDFSRQSKAVCPWGDPRALLSVSQPGRVRFIAVALAPMRDWPQQLARAGRSSPLVLYFYGFITLIQRHHRGSVWTATVYRASGSSCSASQRFAPHHLDCHAQPLCGELDE